MDHPVVVPTDHDLASALRRIDGRPYPAYKDIRGRYDFGRFVLSIDHVQGDPFAAPSRLSVHILHRESGLPEDLFANKARRTGTETCLALAFSAACRNAAAHLGSGKSGLLNIDTPGQQVLHRTCCQITEEATIVRFVAGLPASGRRILGRAAATLLTETIPAIVDRALVHRNLDAAGLQAAANTNEDAEDLRRQLTDLRLVAFVADGAVLPRASGIDDRPLRDAVPFRSPESLRVTVTLPHAGTVRGMGIPEGVTLIVGGGYHGKSTLLNALERGVYNHRPEDGRQLVVSRDDATKVRAEDGRSVVKVNLSAFINNLPGGKDTVEFTTGNASGSTSQAANIIEALEVGSRCLLLDEDISATNFLIRDHRMQQLIAPEKEPITPFVQRVRALYEEHGISTVLVLGGSGDYFEPAHRVIAMDNFLPRDVTAAAKAIAAAHPATLPAGTIPPAGAAAASDEGHADEGTTSEDIAYLRYAISSGRVPDPESIDPFQAAGPYRGGKSGGGGEGDGDRGDGGRGGGRGGDRGFRGRGGGRGADRGARGADRGARGADRGPRPPRERIKAHGTRALGFGSEEIDLSLLPQIIDDSQVRAIGRALAYAREHVFDGRITLREGLEQVTALVARDGLTALDPRPPGDLAEFRIQELAAALNRLRSLRIVS